MNFYTDEELEQIETRLVHFSGADRIVPYQLFLWEMISDIAEKTESEFGTVFDAVCGWYPLSPFESHPEDPYLEISLRIVPWWQSLCNGRPANSSVYDPRKYNYRQDVDPELMAAIFKPKS